MNISALSVNACVCSCTQLALNLLCIMMSYHLSSLKFTEGFETKNSDGSYDCTIFHSCMSVKSPMTQLLREFMSPSHWYLSWLITGMILWIFIMGLLFLNVKKHYLVPSSIRCFFSMFFFLILGLGTAVSGRKS